MRKTETSPAVTYHRVLDRHEPRLVLAHSGLELCGTERLRVPPEGLTLGRELELPGRRLTDGRMSRVHARVEPVAGGWQLRDLGSRNGTQVNGEPLAGPWLLTSGDVVRTGDTLHVFSLGSSRPSPGGGDPFDGWSVASQQIRAAIERAAASRVSVLITGETGVGKEVVARTLHAGSGRAGAFLALNCGGIAESLVESELFGHARGAFTGAVSEREGLVRAAHRGTLFLDEIGEMPLALQVRLLRVLDERAVRPVGSSQSHAVDVRVLAATNRDLAAEVRAGRFRADLFARLAQWLIVVPPLRQRREDLPLLLHELLARRDAAGRALEPDLCEALLVSDWPLNVRGLINVLSTALLATPADAPLALGPQVRHMLSVIGELAGPQPGDEPAPPRAEPPEVDRLRAALRIVHGNVAEAARQLGCSRQQLYRWLRATDIDANEFRPLERR